MPLKFTSLHLAGKGKNINICRRSYIKKITFDVSLSFNLVSQVIFFNLTVIDNLILHFYFQCYKCFLKLHRLLCISINFINFKLFASIHALIINFMHLETASFYS